MREKDQFSNGQTSTNPTSTGELTTNYFDMEQTSAAVTVITDDQMECYVNVLILAVALSSGGTEGIIFEVRTDDNANHSTGEIVVGAVHIPLAEVVAGKKISIKVDRDVMKRYVGGWIRAKSTTYTGTIQFDMWPDNTKIGPNDSIQKVPA